MTIIALDELIAGDKRLVRARMSIRMWLRTNGHVKVIYNTIHKHNRTRHKDGYIFFSIFCSYFEESFRLSYPL